MIYRNDPNHQPDDCDIQPAESKHPMNITPMPVPHNGHQPEQQPHPGKAKFDQAEMHAKTLGLLIGPSLDKCNPQGSVVVLTLMLRDRLEKVHTPVERMHAFEAMRELMTSLLVEGIMEEAASNAKAKPE